jgi:hypothetical protein
MNSENLDSFVISDPADIEGTLNSTINLSPSHPSTNPIKAYNLSLRKKIAERVESLKSKKHFKHIFKLIHNSCPNSYTRDGTGVYINFEVIPNEAIEQVETYLNEVSPKTSLIPLPAKYTPYFSDEFNPKDSGIKLSNHEKNFLKYIGNGSESNPNTGLAIDSESSMRVTSESNAVKTKIIIKPFTFE